MSGLESSLRRVVRRGRVEDGARAAADSWPQAMAWSGAELSRRAPAAAALPADAEETAAVLEWAAREGVPLVPRGGGSGVVGAAVPAGPGCVAVDLSLVRGLSIETGDGAPRAAAGAGWLGGELEERLNREGWSLGHFPASMAISTPGGWVAGGSFGQLSTRYGGIGAQASAVRAALPGGSLMREDASPHLGAEGTLGVLTEVTLRLRRLPSSRGFTAWAFAERGAALSACRETTRARPSVLRLYGPVDAWLSLRPSHGGGGGLLRRLEPWLLRAPALLRAGARLAARDWVAVAVFEDEEGFESGPPAPPSAARPLGEGPARAWWDRRYQWSRDRLARVFAAGCFADTLDLWAPWDRLEAVDDAVLAALGGAFAFRHFGHFDAAGACLYVTLAGAGGPASHARAWDAGLAACAAAGGRVNHHHGVGLAKRAWLANALGAERLAAWTAEKRRRDPGGLLNPGKLRCR